MISVILPVYNPSAGWAENAIAESLVLQRSMPDQQFEFIMVNDGSTSEIYQQEKGKIGASHIRLIEYSPNRGKGEALRRGVAESSGELIVYTDIDFPYTQDSIRNVINILLSGKKDVVIGIKDADYYAHVPAFRRFVSKLLRFFVRLFFRIPTDDFMCGLKGFNMKGKPVFVHTAIDRYLFDLEFMMLLARQKEISTTTLEIHLKENIQFRKMNPQIIRTELRDLARIWLRS
ncbi:MAG: glycosyltransferase family 2 protein [Bacteroidetes bacterium]|nr:glycosyltransferase family 2 protein [Bacteroidota bacterium]